MVKKEEELCAKVMVEKEELRQELITSFNKDNNI